MIRIIDISKPGQNFRKSFHNQVTIQNGGGMAKKSMYFEEGMCVEK